MQSGVQGGVNFLNCNLYSTQKSLPAHNHPHLQVMMSLAMLPVHDIHSQIQFSQTKAGSYLLATHNHPSTVPHKLKFHTQKQSKLQQLHQQKTSAHFQIDQLNQILLQPPHVQLS
jgi:hypothetical protein